MMRMEPLGLTDLEELKHIQPDGWADITEPARHTIESDSRFAYKAIVDERIAGMGAIIYNGSTAWLFAIIVHKDYRNNGIGTAITQFLLDKIDMARFPSVLLDATEFGYPVYKKAGFEVISEHAHFERATPDTDALLSMLIKPFEKKHLDDILQLDKIATGENRLATLLPKIADAFVYLSNDDKVEGFYIPSLSKGLIIANNAEAGIALMQMRLKTTSYCMLPIENKAAIDYLLQMGFTHFKTSKRMRLGQSVCWEPTYIFNVISGAIG